MRKKQPSLGVEEEREVARDVVIRNPFGVVLSVHLDRSEIDQISRAAESLGWIDFAGISPRGGFTRRERPVPPESTSSV